MTGTGGMADNIAKADIHIVESDVALREALSSLLREHGYRVSAFADGAGFLAAARAHKPVCVILDLHSPDRPGLDILADLDAKACAIFVTAYGGDARMAVNAIKRGVRDVFVKPFDPALAVASVRAAVAPVSQMSALTARERQVLAQIAAGTPNKEIGRRLGISARTVEVHRARIMEKLNARNAADLVRKSLMPGGS